MPLFADNGRKSVIGGVDYYCTQLSMGLPQSTSCCNSMRQRLKNTVKGVEGIFYYDHNYLTGHTIASGYGVNRQGKGVIAEMNDVITTGFTGLRRLGRVVMNDMNMTKMTVDYPAVPYMARNRTYDTAGPLLTDVGATLSGPVSGEEHVGQRFFSHRDKAGQGTLLASLPSVEIASEEQVLVAAVANASETDAMALVTLAEAKKTLASISKASDVYHRIWGYMSKLKRTDFTPQGALRHVGTGLAVWLEVRYGLLPTYYEIQGYAQVCRDIGKKSRTRFTSRASGEITIPPEDENTTTTFYNQKISTLRKRQKEIHAGILVEAVAENVGAITSLGIDRIASTAWELVPFSFIVDWFFNTSQTIAAHEGRFSQRDLGTWVTTTDRVITEFRLRTENRDWTDLGPNRRYVGVYQRSFDCREVYESVVRKANPKVPLLPSFKLNLNWKKAVDLAAISGQVLSGLKSIR